jgi:hypothetical protein
MVYQDGSVLGMGWDDEQPSVVSIGWQILAFAAASYQFPDLADLKPARLATAQPCWSCEGAEYEYCFGMGWLPDIVV